MEYKLVIDQKLVDEYAQYYFKLHTRARKKPIENPIPPSLNQILIMKRPQVANIKEKWKAFGIWLFNKLGYCGLMLSKFEMNVTIYFPNKIRRDLDNYGSTIVKFLADPMTESKMIIDDNCARLCKLVIMFGGYDKENPRIELALKEFYDE